MISYFCRNIIPANAIPADVAAAAAKDQTMKSTMQQAEAPRRYSKRKRTQVNYCMSELDVSDDEDEYKLVEVKKRKAVKSKTLPKNKVFPFLELPAEIRNMIYAHCLSDESGINLVGTYKLKRRTTERVSAETIQNLSGSHGYYANSMLNNQTRAQFPEPVALVPALLGVNKQIYAEARDMLYANEFVFLDTQALYSFLVNMGPVATTYLKQLRLLRWGYGRALKAYNHSCFALLASATNIEKFYCDATSGYTNDPKWCAEQLYRDAFPWFEAVGVAKGKVDAVVDVVQVNEERFQKRVYDQATNTAKLVPRDECMETFRGTISKMLIRRHNRVLNKATKKRKTKSKARKDDE